MLNKIQNSSLINWLSGNRLSSDLYVNCLTTDVITNLQVNNKLSLINNATEDVYLKGYKTCTNTSLQGYLLEVQMMIHILSWQSYYQHF